MHVARWQQAQWIRRGRSATDDALALHVAGHLE
jgi:hypothetical protein